VNDSDDYLTVDEIADKLRVSKMTIYRLIHAGELPSVRIGSSFRVTRANLARYLEGN
jgi:excisionase family DNA binding protein